MLDISSSEGSAQLNL